MAWQIQLSEEWWLTEVVQEDAPLLLKWLSDPLVLAFYEGRDKAFTLETIQEKYLSKEGGLHRYIVRYQNAPIGYVQIYPVLGEDLREYGLTPAPGRFYATDQFIGEPELWNQGLGQRMMLGIAHAVFTIYQADVLLSDPQVRNARAVACYLKTGYDLIKRLPAHEKHEGVMEDCYLMMKKNPRLA